MYVYIFLRIHTNHWHAATCEHTDQKDGVAAHTLGADGKCTVCDYKKQPSYTKLTEEQFNALVNKIQTQGIAAEFDLLAKSGDTVLAKEKASFKFDIASTSLEELSYNDTGAVVDGSNTASSAIIASISLIGVTLLLIRKKKEEK